MGKRLKKARPSNKVPWPFFVVMAIASFTFQNCERPAQTRTPAQQAETNDGTDTIIHLDDPTRLTEKAPTFENSLEAAAQPFEEGKVQIHKIGGNTPDGFAQKGAVPQLAGENLIIVLNNECARQQAGPLSRLAYDPAREHAELPSQSYIWKVPDGISIEQLQAAADADDCVIGIANDDIMHAGAAPNDSSMSAQANYNSVGGPESYWFFQDPLRGSTADVIVAVIDSGINHNHEDLKNRLWANPAGGYGYNFRNNTTFVYDDYGHGTAVSGILAAEANNGIGIAGTMGQNVKIMSLKVQNEKGEGLISDIVLAIEYARARNADVINISMEGPTANAALKSSLQAAVTDGSFIAVAAGNGGGEISSTNMVVPAAYSAGIAGVMSVGAIDSYSGAKSSFSNTGTSYIEISAPGSNGVLYTKVDGKYATGVGTSYACPMVAGAGALVISFFKKNGISYTPALVETVLKAAAVKKSNLTAYFAEGRTLNLASLAEYLRRTYLAPVDGGLNEN